MAFRTQKISQMTPKGSDLEATDLIEVSTIESGSYVTRSITGQELIDAIPLPPSGITIGTTAITSGTVGRVLFEGTGNVVQQSANLFWNNTNARLGIGTSSPTKALHVNGNTFIQTVSNSDDGLIISNQGNIAFAGLTDVIGARFRGLASAFQMSDAAYNVKFVFNIASNLSYFNGGGNVAIGTTTDAGFRLDVNGTARVTSSLRVESSFTALSSATIGGTTLAANAILQVNGSGKYVNYNSSFSSGSFLTYQAFGTWEAIGADSPAGTILAFGGYRASQWTGITFHSNGSERMRIDASGNVGIGTSSPATLLDVNGTIKSSILRSDVLNNTSNTVTLIQFSGTGNRLFDSAGTQVLNLRGGNLQIGTTTDAGFKLDVNGTARVKGDFVDLDSSSNERFKITDNGVSGYSYTFLKRFDNTKDIFHVIFPSGMLTTSNVNWNFGIKGNSNNFSIASYDGGASATERFVITNTGNVLIGTSTNGASRLRVVGLPTSSAGLSAGDIWNDAGTLKIV